MAPRGYEDAGLIPGFAEGPPQFTGPPQEPRGHRWGVWGVIVAGLAVVALIVALAASRMGHRGANNAPAALTATGTPTGGSSPSGAASSPAASSSSVAKSGSSPAANRRRALAQASTIAGYLTASGQARRGIGAAISAISGCTNIAAALTTLQHAADVRAGIVTALARTDVSALPNGAAAVADLSKAMRASANADRHYAAWGQAVAACHGHAPPNADLAAAQQSDNVATAAKQRFAAEWNPIAVAYGQAKQSASTI